jgi:hypothetical protein
MKVRIVITGKTRWRRLLEWLGFRCVVQRPFTTAPWIVQLKHANDLESEWRTVYVSQHVSKATNMFNGIVEVIGFGGVRLLDPDGGVVAEVNDYRRLYEAPHHRR